MFPAEHGYQVARRRSIAQGRQCIQADGQKKQWRVDEPCGNEAELPAVRGNCVYAQNDRYLELSNPAWDKQDAAALSTFYVVPCLLLVIWGWYGLSLHPLLFGNIIFLFGSQPYEPDMAVMFWTSWLIFFPLALGAVVLLYLHFGLNGVHTAFFTYARGRIRFNRHTRKVYVLRPKRCGGNAVLDWDRLRAIVDMDGYDLLTRKNIKPGRKLPYYALILYHPPFDASDPSAKGEDALFVGPSLASGDSAPPLWEYIRRYMEEGPGQHGIPALSPLTGSTYCGIPSSNQRKLEDPFASGGFFYWLSVVTCTWPKFPQEWQSDSGLGEPEDKPVQTGAVMTALVYRAEGKLSAEDEMALMTRYGTPEGLSEAQARLAATGRGAGR